MVQLWGGQFRVETREGYVFVGHSRAAQDLSELDVALQAVDQALERASLEQVLFDSRESDYTPPAVQAHLWEWLQRRKFKKIATLVTSKNLAVSVRMTGLSKDVPIRAFDTLALAERWLRS